jgi:hypothetical protein
MTLLKISVSAPNPKKISHSRLRMARIEWRSKKRMARVVNK